MLLQIHISIPLHNRSLLLAPDFGGRGGEGNIKKNDYFHQFEAEQKISQKEVSVCWLVGFVEHCMWYVCEWGRGRMMD